jgi:hypothetical protein
MGGVEAKRKRKYLPWWYVEYIEHVRASIKDIASKLNLPSYIEKEALGYAPNLGRLRQGIDAGAAAAGILYYMCRRHGLMVSPRELAAIARGVKRDYHQDYEAGDYETEDIGRARMAEVLRMYKRIKGVRGGPPLMTASRLLRQQSKALRLPRRVEREAREIYGQIAPVPYPRAATAASLYAASILHGCRRPKWMFLYVGDCSYCTFQKYVREISRKRGVVLREPNPKERPKEPLGTILCPRKGIEMNYYSDTPPSGCIHQMYWKHRCEHLKMDLWSWQCTHPQQRDKSVHRVVLE